MLRIGVPLGRAHRKQATTTPLGRNVLRIDPLAPTPVNHKSKHWRYWVYTRLTESILSPVTRIQPGRARTRHFTKVDRSRVYPAFRTKLSLWFAIGGLGTHGTHGRCRSTGARFIHDANHHRFNFPGGGRRARSIENREHRSRLHRREDSLPVLLINGDPARQCG